MPSNAVEVTMSCASLLFWDTFGIETLLRTPSQPTLSPAGRLRSNSFGTSRRIRKNLERGVKAGGFNLSSVTTRMGPGGEYPTLRSILAYSALYSVVTTETQHMAMGHRGGDQPDGACRCSSCKIP